jgi:transposase
MKLYTGIDLHSNNHYVVVIDQERNRLVEKRLPNDLSKTLCVLEPYREHMDSIAIESTFNWYWLADGLISHGYHVELVNTVAAQQYSGLKHTDDRSDAFWLAHMLQLGILPTGHIQPPEPRALRDLLRKRLQLVEDRTQHLLRVQSQIMRSCAQKVSSRDIKAQNLRPSHYTDDRNIQRALQAELACIALLGEQIQAIETQALSQCRLNPDYKLLNTVFGIGPILAMTIMLEVGDISRFPKVGNFASYCRCVASARFSNGKKKGVNNRKNGNKHLSRAMVEAAYFAARFYQQPRQFMERKTKQVNRTLATKALAHKLAKACYYVLRDQVPFQADKLFA